MGWLGGCARVCALACVRMHVCMWTVCVGAREGKEGGKGGRGGTEEGRGGKEGRKGREGREGGRV